MAPLSAPHVPLARRVGAAVVLAGVAIGLSVAGAHCMARIPRRRFFVVLGKYSPFVPGFPCRGSAEEVRAGAADAALDEMPPDREAALELSEVTYSAEYHVFWSDTYLSPAEMERRRPGDDALLGLRSVHRGTFDFLVFQTREGHFIGRFDRYTKQIDLVVTCCDPASDQELWSYATRVARVELSKRKETARP